MQELQALSPQQLCWHCDPAQFDFETTEQLDDLSEFVGQTRALDAVRFGIAIHREGYNLYVLGPPGVGKRTIVKSFLEQKSADEPQPDDWCYVNNFDDPHQPRALRLPAGRGGKLVQDLGILIEDLHTAIPAALQMEEHRNRLLEVEDEIKERQSKAFQRLAEKAEERGIQLIRTPGGFALAPLREGEVLSPEEYEKLTGDQREQIQAAVEELQNELRTLVEKLPQWRNEIRRKVKEINQEATRFVVGQSLGQLRKWYTDLPQVLKYLDALEANVIERADEFRPPDEEAAEPLDGLVRRRRLADAYRANLIVENGQTTGAPVVYLEHPSYVNLVGRVEHETQMGTLVTDFTLIKPGALHQANGGYLVVEAIRLLQQPFAWEALKRALYSRHIKIESLGESLSLLSTVSLEPEPIPLDVKVVLLGDRMLYYLLYQYDRDFGELFKVAADFEEEMDRTPENCRLYARLIATLVRRESHLPFDRTAVARVLEHSARVAADSEKLTTHMRTVADLLRESDYWATHDGGSQVSARHVQQAIDKQVYRSERLRQHVLEEIRRGTLLIDTSGAVVGQVNGLSVIDLGNFAFGRPSRITATARLGKGEVIDIEREVELGGAIHSKGVLILSSLLTSRYAQRHPLSVSASLVFEQSYGLVEGDSASVGELCALLSALGNVPVRQSLAVTGSVNQLGQVQPIGGVNEKIEGFFDVCLARGLTGDQGVLIPASNVKHLMLREDVLKAVGTGQFHIWPIETVDQALSLLTGLPAGLPDADGRYPAGTINERISERLWELFQLRQKYNSEAMAERPQ
ncbi:MAG: AAA family ATPase [Pirellulaceae bacterium]|jgi:lon-related putative ATP-dependent protease|nr:AAA family ATPase [Pirellulaceae bacterium]MCU0978539.1 AAA family ATPase [Pirellulaceae bacterium]